MIKSIANTMNRCYNLSERVTIFAGHFNFKDSGQLRFIVLAYAHILPVRGIYDDKSF